MENTTPVHESRVYRQQFHTGPCAACSFIKYQTLYTPSAESPPPPPPANTRRWANIVLMLGQRLRRRSNIRTILAQCVAFAGPPLVRPMAFTWIIGNGLLPGQILGVGSSPLSWDDAKQPSDWTTWKNCSPVYIFCSTVGLASLTKKTVS